MANTTWSTVSRKAKPNKPIPRKPSPPTKQTPYKIDDISKLFPIDEGSFAGGVTGRSLADVRKLIYDHAWNRERRDDCKRDFVVSEFGTDRNVMHYSHYFDQQGELRRTPHSQNRCNLMFANKQISAEFLRYVYSVNSLEIDVDLKSQDTPVARAGLESISARLQENPHFQKFTRIIRVRIHFPDKYTYHGLPSINKTALQKIATFIDGCQSMTRLDISIVMMNGPDDYELEYATFPFYPLEFVDWHVQVLNLRTCKFEQLHTEELDYLNNAWDGQHSTSAKPTARTASQKQQVASTPGSQYSTGAKAVASGLRKASSENGGNNQKKTQSSQGPSPTATPPCSVALSAVPSQANTRKQSISDGNGCGNEKMIQGSLASATAATPPSSAAPAPSGDGEKVAARLREPPSPPVTPTAAVTMPQEACDDPKDIKESGSTNSPQTPVRTPTKQPSSARSRSKKQNHPSPLLTSAPLSPVSTSSSSTLDQSPHQKHESGSQVESGLETTSAVANKDNDNSTAQRSQGQSSGDKQEKDKKAKERKRQRQREKRKQQRDAAAKAVVKAETKAETTAEEEASAEVERQVLHVYRRPNGMLSDSEFLQFVLRVHGGSDTTMVARVEEAVQGQAVDLTLQEFQDRRALTTLPPPRTKLLNNLVSDGDEPAYPTYLADRSSAKKLPSSDNRKKSSNKKDFYNLTSTDGSSHRFNFGNESSSDGETPGYINWVVDHSSDKKLSDEKSDDKGKEASNEEESSNKEHSSNKEAKLANTEKLFGKEDDSDEETSSDPDSSDSSDEGYY